MAAAKAEVAIAARSAKEIWPRGCIIEKLCEGGRAKSNEDEIRDLNEENVKVYISGENSISGSEAWFQLRSCSIKTA